jgi:lipoate-protein ligase A
VSALPYTAATWRLLISAETDGATNMAKDEAMLRAVGIGLVPPTLRLYAWAPPCLSLGRGQSGAEVDRAACSRDGVDIVRRPTGGRAILHTDELTYSVIAPIDEPRLAGDIISSYRRLSLALLAGLKQLKVNAEAREMERATSNLNPVCFEVPSHYELTTDDGRKLVGSAQMRTSDAVLQHGTLPLVGDVARICRYLVDAPPQERVRARATTVEQALGRPVSWHEATQGMIAGFRSALNLMFVRGRLMPEEREWLVDLRSKKYASDEWTWRV